MGWYYNGIRIFVTSSDISSKQIIARLQPVNTHTILHYFGHESPIYKLSCKVVGDFDKTDLESLVASGLSYSLEYDLVSLGNFALNSISFKQDDCIKQSLRSDLAEDSPVYTTDLELYLEE